MWVTYLLLAILIGQPKILMLVVQLEQTLGQTAETMTFALQALAYHFCPISRDLCINRNNHQKSTFHPLGDFLNPALALLEPKILMLVVQLEQTLGQTAETMTFALQALACQLRQS
jgi:hypothetical protein